MSPQFSSHIGYDLGYLQVVVGLFVFALGLPSLLLGVAVEERVRHLIHRRFFGSTFVLMASLTILTLTCALCLLWVEQPWSAITRWMSRATTSAALVVDAQTTNASTSPSSVSASSSKPGQDQGKHEDVPQEHLLVASSLLTLYFVLAIALYWRLITLDVRSSLVRKLKNKLVKAKQPSNANRRAVEDLIALGELGSPGYQKLEVLNAIEEITSTAIKEKTFTLYHASLLRSAVDIATSAEGDPSIVDLVRTAEILNSVRSTVGADGTPVEVCEQALVNLARAAGHRCSQFHAEAILRALPRPFMIFTLGSSAIASNNYPVAISIVNHLEKDAELNRHQITVELAGMLTLFWQSSRTARRRVEVFIRNWGGVDDRLLRAFQKAEDSFYQRGDFSTADQIHAFIEERLAKKAA